jgi:exosortase O
MAWQLPPQIAAEAWPLAPEEQAWLSDNDSLPVTGSRWRFTAPGLSGSLLFVTSDTWRAQHRPERCFTVYGLEVQESRLHLVAPDFPLRWLALGTPGEGAAQYSAAPLYSAAYWLQSSERVTDDYAARIWDDMAPRPQTWVLVTALFDAPVDPASPAAQALFTALRASVVQSLDGH